MSQQLKIFGIRHHGPGCARRLMEALQEYQPDALAIEAPADVADVLSLADDPNMVPPVAMLVYPEKQPAHSRIFPLAVFSPEWQAIRWALSKQVPIFPMDLPMSHSLPLDHPGLLEHKQNSASASGSEDQDNDANKGEDSDAAHLQIEREQAGLLWRTDPIGVLAEAAGYQDQELWWEEQIERRNDANGLFEAILSAMTAVRDELPETSVRDLQREAFMRKTIRGLQKSGYSRVAIVCGAWHSPVLTETALAGKIPGLKLKDDAARLKGLPKIKTVATWIPWTQDRFAYRSGYGAGVHSPGWYAHLWESPEQAPTRWLVDSARIFREQDLSVSSASVIEARRLADALASVRDRASPGLTELNDSIQSVMCHGQQAPMNMIRRRLELGDLSGRVPSHTPSVPLERDLKQLQTSLRLKPSTIPKVLKLDLRNENDRLKSQLLHRLNLLGIDWGIIQPDSSEHSSFREMWNLEWRPQFPVLVIEANVWGNTVLEASQKKACEKSRLTDSLKELSALLHIALHSDLEVAVQTVMLRIQAVAAITSDVLHLMQSVPQLVQIYRYGDARQTDTQALHDVLIGIIQRIQIGLIPACSGIDDSTASEFVQSVSALQYSIHLLQETEIIDQWRARIRKIADSQLHPLLRGFSVRTLLEQSLIDQQEFERFTRQIFSPGTPVEHAAAWIEGLLTGSGLMLMQHPILWRVMNDWICSLDDQVFIETLPVLRRSFSSFSRSERRQMSDLVNQLSEPIEDFQQSAKRQLPSRNEQRARLVLPILAQLVGVSQYES